MQKRFWRNTFIIYHNTPFKSTRSALNYLLECLFNLTVSTFLNAILGIMYIPDQSKTLHTLSFIIISYIVCKRNERHIPDIFTSSLLNTNHNEKKWSTPKLAVNCPSIPDVSGNSNPLTTAKNAIHIAGVFVVIVVAVAFLFCLWWWFLA